MPNKRLLYNEEELKNSVWELGVALPFINTDFNTFEKNYNLYTSGNYVGHNYVTIKGNIIENDGIRPGDLIWVGPSTSNILSNIYKGNIKKGNIGTVSYDSVNDLTTIYFDISSGTISIDEFTLNDNITIRGLAYGWNMKGIYSYKIGNIYYYDQWNEVLDGYKIPFNINSSNDDRFERADPLFDSRKFSQRIIRFGELCQDNYTGFCKYCVYGYPTRNGGTPQAGYCGNPNQLTSKYGTLCNGDPTVGSSTAFTCKDNSSGYDNELDEFTGIKQTFIKENLGILNYAELKDAVLRISLWFNMIPLTDFNNNTSKARLIIKMFNANKLGEIDEDNRDENEYLYMQTMLINSATPNYLLSATMPVGGYDSESGYDYAEDSTAVAYYEYKPINSTKNRFPLFSHIQIGLKGTTGVSCRVNCDIQYVVAEHAKGTSKEIYGYFSTNTTPDVGKTNVEIINTNEEIKMGSGKLVNFDVQGGNEKFKIEATWSNENEQFVKDIKVLEDWSKKGYAIVLRANQFDIIPPVLFTKISVEEQIMKNTKGLGRYNVKVIFTEL